ncbi:MAG TPA: low molecular weight phosphatase family protein [Anaerolineaceae bacterium]|nr:low molecular weight phosphatase family protein [Anaerolineaceae bacterium]
MESGEYAHEILVGDAETNENLGVQSQPDEAELKQRKRVLFLCTGNSARSQMAEAIVNHDLWNRWIAVSAGTRPAGYVHPYALAALEEAGIFHQGESKSVEVFKGQNFDLVVTVCDQAREACPLWLGPEKRIHVGFEDPAAVQGTEEEKMAAFRKTLKLIRATIPAVLKEFED